MCGIVGFTGPPDRELLTGMGKRIRHRGPDAWGFFEDSAVSLGCRRLRIRDRSPKADQPLQDSGGRCIVYNGELFNNKEIRERLTQTGFRFSTCCDTETVLTAYTSADTSCVRMLDGMFAFAIWDPLKHSLMLARDPAGIKPLYYMAWKGNLYFASELKALLAVPGFERSISDHALVAYLTYGCNPLEESLIKGIFKLPPGGVLLWKGPDSFSIDVPKSPSKSGNVPVQPEMLLRTITDSVLSATADLDSPALFQSGGVDSALLLAILSSTKKGIGTVRTYTAGFSAYDESPTATALAEHFGCEHINLLIGPEHMKELPKVVWHGDEALGDPTALPMFALSREASRKSRVILTGDGGDELFYGYEQLRFLNAHSLLVESIPAPVKNCLAKLLPYVPSRFFTPLFQYAKGLGEKGRFRAQGFLREPDALERYLKLVSIFDSQERAQFLECDISPLNQTRMPLQGGWNLDALAHFDRSIFLADKMLAKTDRMTMAHGVEGRPPYLSSRLIAMADAIPASEKMGLLSDKVCLRRAARLLLPRKFVPPTKHRFFVPVHTWFEDDMPAVCDLVLSSPLRNIFNPTYATFLQNISERFHRSPLYYSRQLWNLLILSIWTEQFIEHDGAKALKRGLW